MKAGAPAAVTRTALFVVSIYNYHREVFPVVREFAANGWRVAVIVGWLGRLADDAASAYRALGCEVHRLPPGIAYGDPDQALGGGRHAPAPAARPSIPTRILAIARNWRVMRRTDRVVRTLLASIAPDAVLCGPFHSCGTFDNAIARWARTRRVPLCCYAVSTYHGAKGAIRARFNNLRLGMLPPDLSVKFDPLNRAAARLFPAWTQRRGEDGIFMWDPTRMLAARTAGLLEADIWQKPSPDFDAVFVFSAFSAHLLRDAGYPMAHVVVAGIPLLDDVFRDARDPARRAALLGALGLREGEAFLLFNVEPSAEHHYADWDEHWRNFRTMMNVVTGFGLPVVLSLHPLCREQDYVFAETEFGVRIARAHKIYDLYPHCRLAVSFPCSTRPVAGGCAPPPGVYDWFRIAAADSERAEEYRLPFAKVGHSADEVAALIAAVLSEGPPAPGAGSEHDGRASAAIRVHVERMIEERTAGRRTGPLAGRAPVARAGERIEWTN